MGGPGGAYVAIFFSNFLLFKIEPREVLEYAAEIISHPPPGGTPHLVRAGAVGQGQNFRNFWDDQKKSKNIVFPKWTPKTYFESSEPHLPLYDVFFDRFASYASGNTSKTAQIRVKISQFWLKNL